MKGIIRFSLHNKFALWLLTLIVTSAGLYAGFTMKLESIPNINPPLVTVQTAYPGASPEEVAEKVTGPLEQRVRNMPGVDIVTSSSMQNVSSIQVQYTFDKDMDEAEDEVKEALAKPDLPEGAQDPEISRLRIDAFPVMAVSLTDDQHSMEELTSLAKDEVVPALEGVEGVASVDVAGQQVKEAQLEYKPDAMKKYGLQESAVNDLIKASAGNIPLGLHAFGDSEKQLKVQGELRSVKELKKLEIPITGGQAAPGSPGTPGAGQPKPGGLAGVPTVRLEQIAAINEVSESESINRTNGKDSIGIQIVKAPDANTVNVVDGVKKELDRLKDEHDGLQSFYVFDQGKPIEESVETMLNKALIGAAFAFLVILLFLRNFRFTLIAVISIPLSLVMGILVLKQMDITLNIMTLGAMTVAIGRVVDDSIVIIENIYRRMNSAREKLRGKELVLAATREMFIPILSSTVVTVAVFLPLALVKGPVGELFMPFALTVCFALLSSLVVAITLVPMLSHSLFKKRLEEGTVSGGEEEEVGRLARGYRRFLNTALNHKWIASITALVLLGGSLFLVPVIGVSFLPSDEEKTLYVTFNPEPGKTEKEVVQVAERATDYFQDRTGVDLVQVTVGGENPMNSGKTNQVLFFVKYQEDFGDFEAEKDRVMAELQTRKDPGDWETQDMGGSTGTDNSLELHVYGNSTGQLRTAVKDVIDAADRSGQVKNTDSSLSDTYEEYAMVPDRKALAENGLTPAQLGSQLGRIGERPVVTTLKRPDGDVEVYLDSGKESYESEDDLKKKKILTPLGKEVTLDRLMDIEEGKSPDTVARRDGKLNATVTMEIKGDDVGKATRDVQREVDKLDLPSGVSVEVGGVSEQINEAFTQLGLAMLAAVAIVYLVLVITFGGALAPFAILFSLPFTVIGGLAALWIAGETLSISAMIGALMLIGIVVTNAIVLIDRVIRQEREGLSTREALLEAAGTRLRPILMTAIATIGALLPLAFGLEGGGLISKGLGVTVIGGLTSSTLLTLVVVPVVYEILTGSRRGKKKA